MLFAGCEPAPKVKLVEGAGAAAAPPPNWKGAEPEVFEAAPKSKDGGCEVSPLDANGFLNASPPPAVKLNEEPPEGAGAAPPNEKPEFWLALGVALVMPNMLLVWVLAGALEA